MLLEKLVKKCCVWKWCLFSSKIKGETWDYAILSKTWDVNAILWTVSIWIDKKGNIVFIKNYRHAIDTICWEMPRWAMEEWLTMEENAFKEFKEEIWIQEKPIEIKCLWKFATDSWIIAGYVWYIVLMYEDFSKYDVWWKKDGHYESILEVKYLTKKDVEKMIKNNDIVDAFTVAAWWLLKTHNLI